MGERDQFFSWHGGHGSVPPTMATAITLQKPSAIDWQLQPPGSKSITNRALLLAAIARGRTVLQGWLDAEDTHHMRNALATLGITVTENEHLDLVIDGVGGPLPIHDPTPEVFVGTAGTVARFLLAIAAASPGTMRMDGTPRMRERPMGMLVDALCDRGAKLVSETGDGCLPLRIGPHPAGFAGGEIRLARPASSQFVSGLVFSALLAREPTTIVLEQGTPARPYVDMTLEVVRSFGGRARWRDASTLEIEPSMLTGTTYRVEPDASAASYPLALAAIYGGETVIRDLGTLSMQGDVGFAKLLGRMGAKVAQSEHETRVEGTGVLRGGSFDLSDMPDMTLTLAVAALFAEGTTEITGVGILRHHESDRLAAGATELRKLGAIVTEREEGLVIEPPRAGLHTGVEIETYKDHRMAMAFALAGDVTILDPECVGKTYPTYFQHLAAMGMVVHRP